MYFNQADIDDKLGKCALAVVCECRKLVTRGSCLAVKHTMEKAGWFMLNFFQCLYCQI